MYYTFILYLISWNNSHTGTVQYFFPGKTDAEIKGYIRQKLQNEAKRLRKKPYLSGQYESRGLNLPSPKSHLDMIDQNWNIRLVDISCMFYIKLALFGVTYD